MWGTRPERPDGSRRRSTEGEYDGPLGAPPLGLAPLAVPFARRNTSTLVAPDSTLDDGTLKEVESDGDKPPKTSTDGGRGDRPLTWSEQRDQSTTIEATREVPGELRRLWSDLSVSRPMARTRI